ncbi:alpha/beta hydrolase [Mycolicibacterium goodii]|uniref:alpha/beta hydrolase n=1 Tax=Mycolicibacterium goodii TaxID=134601 RepID=UPI001BDBCF4E|nr:alpha/beta fold hydrolase [Mycolicibacterium goodii]MBU8814797.1 alpha/beta hydrolase [Mycolicibacterium goodii]
MSAADSPPILFLHSMFGTPDLVTPWVEALSGEGYDVHVPALPGRDPIDEAVLARTGIDECLSRALDAYDRIGEPAVVIGHSLGGLLAQKIAALREPVAVVLLASVPPGVLWPQLRALPHLAPLLPKILAGKPFLPSLRTLREVPLSTLAAHDRDALARRMVPDSGRVFREMCTGGAATRVDPAQVTCPVLCVSGGADRNVAGWISRRIAERYRAEHWIHPDAPHWIIAESLVPAVAPPVLAWLRRVLDASTQSPAQVSGADNC